MINASDEEVLALFERVHGEMTLSCSAEIVHDEEWNVIGVACMKDGREAWRATLPELLLDLYVMDRGVGK